MPRAGLAGSPSMKTNAWAFAHRTIWVRVRDVVNRTYRLGVSRRVVNAVITPLTRLGLAGRHTYLLTVRGRKTGRPHSTPVTLVENGERWLVAPYGEVSWVWNARAAGEVTLQRAGRAQTVRIEEVGPQEAAPVL